MTNNLIFRVRHLQEFTVTTEIHDDFRFNGPIPFDMNIVGSIIEAKVWAVDFDEAVNKLNEYLETCR